MKKNTVFVLAVLAMALMTACKSGTPKDVAREWLTDFYHQDYDDARKLSTEDTKNMMNILQGFTNALPDSVKQRAKRVTINIKSVNEQGNTATVTFTTSEDPNNVQPPLKLVKQNDKWLVQFSKADFAGSDKNDPMNMASPADSGTAAPATAPATDAPMTTPDTATRKQE